MDAQRNALETKDRVERSCCKIHMRLITILSIIYVLEAKLEKYFNFIEWYYPFLFWIINSL